MSNDTDTIRMGLADTLAAIAAPLPAGVVSSKVLKGNTITFITWHDACALMDQRAPGWCYEVKEVGHLKDQVYVTVRVTVFTSEGPIHREATGNESDQTSGYGDPFSNSESMALRRAFAKFGLALELYKGKVSGGSQNGSSNGHKAASNGAGGDDLATQKQRNFMAKLAKDLFGDQTPAIMRAMMIKKTGVDASEKLSKAQASAMIEWLKGDTAAQDAADWMAKLEDTSDEEVLETI